MSGVLTDASDNNTAIGYNTLLGMTSGSGNTAVGSMAGSLVTTGTKNTLIGCGAGDVIEEGDENTYIGYDVVGNSTNAQNRAAIGYNITTQADDSVTLGNNDVTAIYCAQDSGATVHCAAVQIADGGNIGSASDTDAMAITAAGSVLFNTISYGSSQQITIGSTATNHSITVTNKRVFIYNTHSGAQISTINFLTNVGGIGAQVFFQLDNSSTQAITFNEGGNIVLSGTTSSLNGKLNGVLVLFYDGAKWLEQSYTALD